MLVVLVVVDEDRCVLSMLGVLHIGTVFGMQRFMVQ